MSTQAIVRFYNINSDEADAAVLKFCDGYPDGEDGMLKYLDDFFNAMQERGCTNLSEAGKLAAYFLVYTAKKNQKGDDYLDFSSVQVAHTEDEADYVYHVRCPLDVIEGGNMYEKPTVCYSQM